MAITFIGHSSPRSDYSPLRLLDETTLQNNICKPLQEANFNVTYVHNRIVCDVTYNYVDFISFVIYNDSYGNYIILCDGIVPTYYSCSTIIELINVIEDNIRAYLDESVFLTEISKYLKYISRDKEIYYKRNDKMQAAKLYRLHYTNELAAMAVAVIFNDNSGYLLTPLLNCKIMDIINFNEFLNKL